MERRGFLKLFGAAVAGIALEQAIPFNRVWSFPKNIVVPKTAVGGILQVKVPPLFEIGDLVSIGVFPEFKDRIFEVRTVFENGGVNLVEHTSDPSWWALGNAPQKLLTPAFPPATSRPSTS